MMMAVYTRTQSAIDLEEQTGKAIEDFLDEDCFVRDDDDYEEEYDEEDEEYEDEE